MHPDTQETHETSFWGYAAEDLIYGSDQLKVLPISQLPASMSGTVGPGTTQSSATTTNSKGQTTTSKVTTTNFITATFAPDANRPTPPMVKQGEQVKVFCLDNTDKWYWQPHYRDRNIRSLDVHRIEVSAIDTSLPPGKKTASGVISKGRNVVKDDTNTYFVEMNGIEGYLLISTSQANGEKVAYRIRMDGKTGALTVSDNKTPPNQFCIDSATDSIKMQNNKKAVIHLDGEDGFIEIPRDLLIKVGRQIVSDTPAWTFNDPRSSSQNASNGVMVINAGYITTNIKNSWVQQGGVFGMNCNVKVTGSCCLNDTRYTSMSEGPIGNSYQPSTIYLDQGVPNGVSNSADTNTSGGGNRHATANEQFVEFADKVTSMFSEVSGKIGVPSGGGLTDIANSAKMSDLKAT